ncbi:M48 family metalloprotease [Janibacter melonis]|uniref:M48 family metalloprotease n=1 Tax=Janibacter melonis TaxID=262209 RepID=A0A5P8FJC6_9MICO|nr:M56 family metallopeptidase [Janibacter melonis]QFQ29251.2 M48 family metalloprotease [Janibacter melonis]
MTAILLVALGVLLVTAAPRVLSAHPGLRRSPRPALMLWQATALAGVICVVAAGPIAAVTLWPLTRHGLDTAAALLALVASALTLSMLLVNGHVVGTTLRAARRRHEDLLDLVGDELDRRVTVVEHHTPTAYCVPGRHRRVVLSSATLRELPQDELEAVLAHERAHLAERHDLLLEYFTVTHSTAPRWLRSSRALTEVRLLVEVLADRAARQHVGDVPLARALVRLAGSRTPEAMLGVAEHGLVQARMELLADDPAPQWHAAGVYALVTLVYLLPLAVLVTTL